MNVCELCGQKNGKFKSLVMTRWRPSLMELKISRGFRHSLSQHYSHHRHRLLYRMVSRKTNIGTGRTTTKGSCVWWVIWVIWRQCNGGSFGDCNLNPPKSFWSILATLWMRCWSRSWLENTENTETYRFIVPESQRISAHWYVHWQWLEENSSRKMVIGGRGTVSSEQFY